MYMRTDYSNIQTRLVQKENMSHALSLFDWFLFSFFFEKHFVYKILSTADTCFLEPQKIQNQSKEQRSDEYFFFPFWTTLIQIKFVCMMLKICTPIYCLCACVCNSHRMNEMARIDSNKIIKISDNFLYESNSSG